MIRFLLLQNRAGKTRLAKYYVPLDDDEKHQLEREVHRVVVNRDPKHTNFVEYRAYKIIYRRYAGLFFSLCVDVNDNELALLEAVHLFVEVLDHFFGNVCELDLVFNFHKVYLIIDEFIRGGDPGDEQKANHGAPRRARGGEGVNVSHLVSRYGYGRLKRRTNTIQRARTRPTYAYYIRDHIVNVNCIASSRNVTERDSTARAR